jgi:hypothetical protein
MPRIETAPRSAATKATKTDPAQLKAIWSLAKKAGLNEAALRGLNQQVNKTTHLSSLTPAQGKKLLGALEVKVAGLPIKGMNQEQKAVAAKLDKNKDGRIARDDFRTKKDFDAAKRTLQLLGDAPVKPTTGPKDTTPKGLIEKHLKEYGSQKVGYQEALQKGIQAILTTDEGGEEPRSILREFADPPMTKKQLDAEMARLVNAGSFELLPVGEAEESCGDPETDWIFRARVDVGSDHGFWVSVNRETGEAMVNGFN